MQNALQKTSPLLDVNLVRQLITLQFPQWIDEDLTPVVPGGLDNRTFRLGDDKLVRLPSGAAYADQVEKEQLWLPRLAPHLSLPIPEPIAKGTPTDVYPWPWSIYRWLAGEAASEALVSDKIKFAHALANFLKELHRVDISDGPQPGRHNFFRGGALQIYDGEVRSALEALSDCLDTDLALAVWTAALNSPWEGSAVWVHGDLACGNLLTNAGELCAVIDFGCAAVGDPACDLAIAWTFFDEESRRVFRTELPLDHGTWLRGRGWALWKALITLAKLDLNVRHKDPAFHTLGRVLADHR